MCAMKPADGSRVPKLAVVLGTYNRVDMLERCLKSIRLSSPPDTVVHVTDAGSTDGTVEFLKTAAGPRLVPHLIGKKLGQAKSLNDVFSQLDSAYVAWVSDDNIMLADGLSLACRILDEELGIGMIALKVKDVLGPFVDAPYIGGVSTAGILNVNQGMLRRDVLMGVGGFSEEFMDYGIDPDLTAKVLFAGHRIAYTKPVVIHHYRQWAAVNDTKGQQILKEKHDHYYRLYNQKYMERRGPSPAWDRKMAFWNEHHARIARSVWLQGPRSLLGMNMRDWMNVLKGRYIRIWDCWHNRGKAHHLVQHLSHDATG
jgi:GT2 family glycosyltransferase